MPFADVKDGHNSIENYWSNFKWPEQFNIDEIPIQEVTYAEEILLVSHNRYLNMDPFVPFLLTELLHYPMPIEFLHNLLVRQVRQTFDFNLDEKIFVHGSFQTNFCNHHLVMGQLLFIYLDLICYQSTWLIWRKLVT